MRQGKSLNGIEIHGANTGNLKNVTCIIPHNALAVILGPSGSGKSSFLAELDAVSSTRMMELILRGRRKENRTPDRISPAKGSAKVSGSGRSCRLSADRNSGSRQRFGFATGLYQQIAHLFAIIYHLQFGDSYQALGRKVLELSSLTDLLCCVELCLDGSVRQTLLEMGVCYVVHEEHLELLDDVPDQVVVHPVFLLLSTGTGKDDVVRRFFAQARELGSGNIVLLERSQDGKLSPAKVFKLPDLRETIREEQLLPEAPWACGVCQGLGCDSCHDSGAGEQACSVEVFSVRYIHTLTKTPAQLEELLSPFWDTENLSGISQTSQPRDGLTCNIQTCDSWTVCANHLKHNLSLLIAAGLGDICLDAEYEQLTELDKILERLCFYSALKVTGGTFLLDQLFGAPDKEAAGRLLYCLGNIISLGNTVVAAGSIPGVLSRADYLIEFGPGSGSAGGELLYAGPVDKWLDRYLVERGEEVIKGTRFVEVADLAMAKLAPGKGIPAGKVITTLSDISNTETIEAFLRQQDGFRRISAAEVKVCRGGALSGNSNSSFAVLSGLMVALRQCFAQTSESSVRGLREKDFSLSRSSYLCSSCKGKGRLANDGICQDCQGSRFSATVSEVRLREYAFHEALSLDVATLSEVFSVYLPIARLSRPLVTLGLGHVHLEQQFATLSSGEKTRFSVFSDLPLGKKPQVAVFDFSGVSLLNDVRQLIYRALDDAAGQGHTILLREA